MKRLLFVVLLGLSVSHISARAQTCEPSSELLNGNNVEAAVYNDGFLFWNGSGNSYLVPKLVEASAIFTASLWVGGIVEEELRLAATDYGPAEFQPGPLASTVCGAHHRIYKLTREDIRSFDGGADPTDDIAEWPWHLGAPVLDGDGQPDNYDLNAGDRPAVTGDQTLWWIMNDAGPHGWSESPPLNLEVSVTAAAISEETFQSAFGQPFLSDVLDHATLYTYRLRYLGETTLRDAYVGFYVDPDVGNASDDYVGSDSLLGLAFAYNGDNFDEGGYANRPAAVGFDFVRGLKAPAADGIDNDHDGIVDEDRERMAMTSFVRYWKGNLPHGGIYSAEDAYRYLQGTWKDGSPITVGSDGFSGNVPTAFMYSGSPPDYWSMDDLDGSGEARPPSDQIFLMSMGPVDMEPGEEQEFVLGILWADAPDRLDAVRKLKNADEVVQTAIDSGLLEPSRRWLDVSISTPPIDLPASRQFGLRRNYPNPFRAETTIAYELRNDVHVRLGVYDLLGREVAVLVDGRRPGGSHETTFEADGLPAGVYFVRMATVFGTATRPIVVSQ